MITKEKWVSIMKTSGFSEADMRRWHAEFERSAPQEHQEFLEFLHIPAAEDYHRQWGLSEARLKQAEQGCFVLHPGPMNRGVEISSEVADSPQSLIRRQVRNGLHTRMALLLTLTRAQA